MRGKPGNREEELNIRSQFEADRIIGACSSLGQALAGSAGNLDPGRLFSVRITTDARLRRMFWPGCNWEPPR